MEKKDIITAKPMVGQRLDFALVHSDLNLSRKKIRAIIDAGGVFVNQKRARFASRKLNDGDKITIQFNLNALKKLKTQSFQLREADIILEDEGFVVFNKPPGLASEATKHERADHVLSCLGRYYKSRGIDLPPNTLRLVHRLDRETSGLMIVAKDAATATYFDGLFRERRIQKEYHALSLGVPEEETFTENCRLSPIQPMIGTVKIVKSGGRPSETTFKLLNANKEEQIALMACYPKTGRSHQIRVHLRHRNLPIVGDKKYGNASPKQLELIELAAEHHMLHAIRLSFPHPRSNDIMRLFAAYPKRFREMCERLTFQGDPTPTAIA